MLEASEAFAAKLSKADLESLRGRLTAATCRFSQHLATQRRACLAQIWVPDAAQDGSVTLHTQGVPFCVAGCADLLALFRCVSCQYKFGTDTSKPALMGAVGRVFTSGKPEMTHNVQQYDKTCFLRVDEAQRCRVHSALFMPLYASTAHRHPIGVFEVVQASTDVLFPVLVQWLKCCLQEVQLYTADPDQDALTVGLRTPPRPPASGSPKPTSNRQADKQTPSATMTHCSASSLHVQRHIKGSKQPNSPPTASDGAQPLGRPRVHEVSADSEEEKTSSSVGRGSRSPETSSAPLGPCGPCGPCGASFSKREGSGELQSVSGGSFATPAPTPAPTLAQAPATTCLPAQLVTVGKTLQLQTSPAPKDFQTPFHACHTSVPIVPPSVSTTAAVQSPFLQLQQQQQQQQQQLQHRQRQQQLQFLANALQLQSQLNAHVQNRPGTAPATGGSAFAGYQPFSPTAPAPLLASLVQQHSAPAPRQEDDAADEEVQVNNRVAGGAGKRLSVEDLQSQFGVGLREAAHNLRICPTTLKRACRRHGIYRWPRRQDWGAGDDGRTDSMNLDGDLVPPAGLSTGCESQPQASAAPTAAAGEQGLPVLLSSHSCGLLPLQTPFAGQAQGPLHDQLTGPPSAQASGQGHAQNALEGFQRLDSAAQIAVLQRLTAAKADAPDNKWLQGNALSTSLKPSGPLPTAPAVTTSAATGLAAPVRQFGTGMVASMLATGHDHSPSPHYTPTPQLHHPPSASQPPGIISQQALLKASVPPQSTMLRQHSASSHLILPAFVSQRTPNPFLDRQGCALGQPPATAQQGIFQQVAHMSSGLFPQPGSLPAALSGNSSFTSLPSSLVSVPQPGLSLPWQHQSQTQAQPLGMMQAASMQAASMLTQQSRTPALTFRGGVSPSATKPLQPSMFTGGNPFLQDKPPCYDLPLLSVKHESPVEDMERNVIDNIGLETPTDMDSGSGQGSAAMEFDVSDHGLGSLDFLGEAGLDLDHSGALDFDPEDCMF